DDTAYPDRCEKQLAVFDEHPEVSICSGIVEEFTTDPNTVDAKYYAVGDGMHEDFAMWLNILKDGRKAYGVDEPLLIYRIAKSS
ncbi:amylovoran biosynthesis protein AmsE, partial [Faecalibacterium duncaniae]|nr:amylovoran biosynthesis protein AmsE [Faecalibacterium duncaniae]